MLSPQELILFFSFLSFLLPYGDAITVRLSTQRERERETSTPLGSAFTATNASYSSFFFFFEHTCHTLHVRSLGSLSASSLLSFLNERCVDKMLVTYILWTSTNKHRNTSIDRQQAARSSSKVFLFQNSFSFSFCSIILGTARALIKRKRPSVRTIKRPITLHCRLFYPFSS